MGYLLPLSNMSQGRIETYTLWHYQGDFGTGEVATDYLQCAGRAGAMSVGLRVTRDDGSHTHWVLGRTPPTGQPTEAIPYFQHSLTVHAEEVWTAEQAAPLFEQYSATRTIPDWVHRRVVDV